MALTSDNSNAVLNDAQRRISDLNIERTLLATGCFVNEFMLSLPFDIANS